MKKYLYFLFAYLFCMNALYAQLTVNGVSGITPQKFVEDFFNSPGITISNAKINGSSGPISQAQGYDYIGTFNGEQTNVGIADGIILSSGNINSAVDLSNDGSALGMNGDTLIKRLVGKETHDAVVLEFDFSVNSDFISFDYVFASNEYGCCVNTNYNDAFGFFVSGPNPEGGIYNETNIALVPGTSLPVTINNINSGNPDGSSCSYCQYYLLNNYSVDNTHVAYYGMTTVLTAAAKIVPNQTYHLKLVVADVSDAIVFA